MTLAILKWNVPVDDQPHKIGNGPVVLVDSQFGEADLLQVWTLEHGTPEPTRLVQIFGTGHLLPNNAKPIGSVVVAQGILVWHLLEVEE